MLEDNEKDKTEQLLEAIIRQLPAEYRGSKVISCGNYKGIINDGEPLIRYLPGNKYEEIYANKVINGLGIAVVCGLKNMGYKIQDVETEWVPPMIRKNPLNNTPYFNSGIGMSVFFENSK